MSRLRGLLVDRHATFVEQPSGLIDDPPAHQALRCQDRGLLDDLGKRPFVLKAKHRAKHRTELLAQTARLAVQQAVVDLGIDPKTQSRTVCKPTPPPRAASCLAPPS